MKALFNQSLLAMCLLLNGCIGHDIALVEIQTGKIVCIDGTQWKQRIISVSDDYSFFTISRGSKEQLICKYDQNGILIQRQSLPLFTEFFLIASNYTFLPNTNCIVYRKDDSNNLYLYDINNKNEYEIWKDIASTVAGIRFMDWISDKEILMVLADDRGVNRNENEIVIINLVNKTKKVLAKPDHLLFSFALSPDRTLLAYLEFLKGHGGQYIQILDLKKGQVIARLGNGENVANPVWSLDGKRLGYVQGDYIMAYTIDKNTLNQVKRLEDDILLYGLLMYDDMLIYHFGKEDKKAQEYNDSPLMVYNIQKNTIIKNFNIDVNGNRLFYFGPGEKILCEVNE